MLPRVLIEGMEGGLPLVRVPVGNQSGNSGVKGIVSMVGVGLEVTLAPAMKVPSGTVRWG